MSKLRWRSRWTRWPVMMSAAAVTVATMAAPAAVSAASSRADAGAVGARALGARTLGARTAGPPVPVLHWRSCASDFQCATAQVPLSYQDPHGQTISIAMMRHPAAGPGTRLGSLFFNQGGPAPQNDSFAQAYLGLPATVRARYDVISFDMRGYGQSTTISCFPTQRAENKFLANLPVFPVGHRQQQAWEQTAARFDARCARSNSALLAHDSTQDSARDMDLLRQAVGDPVLNYYGESYGTGLGAIYANLFPTRTGHMVFDGNIDPTEWTQHGGLPGHLRARADVSDARTMAAFLRPLFAWQYETCARWPREAATDRFPGPWNAPTAGTILLIGNTTDPATPYHDSVIMEHDLAHSRLLTVHGYGHTEITNPSTCAARYVTRYLITGALPPAGTVCQQNAVPFGA